MIELLLYLHQTTFNFHPFVPNNNTRPAAFMTQKWIDIINNSFHAMVNYFSCTCVQLNELQNTSLKAMNSFPLNYSQKIKLIWTSWGSADNHELTVGRVITSKITRLNCVKNKTFSLKQPRLHTEPCGGFQVWNKPSNLSSDLCLEFVWRLMDLDLKTKLDCPHFIGFLCPNITNMSAWVALVTT